MPAFYLANEILIVCTNWGDALYELVRYKGALLHKLVEGGRTIQGDVLIEESALNEVFHLTLTPGNLNVFNQEEY